MWGVVAPCPKPKMPSLTHASPPLNEPAKPGLKEAGYGFEILFIIIQH